VARGADGIASFERMRDWRHGESEFMWVGASESGGTVTGWVQLRLLLFSLFCACWSQCTPLSLSRSRGGYPVTQTPNGEVEAHAGRTGHDVPDNVIFAFAGRHDSRQWGRQKALWKGGGIRAYCWAMGNDVHTHRKDQIGEQLSAEPEKQRLDLRGKSVAEIVSILTSPPIGGDGIDDPLSHVSPRAALLSSVEPDSFRFADAPPSIPRIANAPPMAPGIGGSNLPPLNFLPLEGEIVAEDLTSRDPARPAPPLQTGQRPVVALFGRLSFLAILAAIVAISVTVMMFPNEVQKRSDDIAGMMTPLLEGSSSVTIPTKLPRLVVKSIKGFVNEPLQLGVSMNDASDGEWVILAGFAIGTRLSTGTPLGSTSWQMSARDVGNALVYAPKDFVGVMAAAIDLRSPSDWLLDSQTVRHEWIPAGRQDPRR